MAYVSLSPPPSALRSALLPGPSLFGPLVWSHQASSGGSAARHGDHQPVWCSHRYSHLTPKPRFICPAMVFLFPSAGGVTPRATRHTQRRQQQRANLPPPTTCLPFVVVVVVWKAAVHTPPWRRRRCGAVRCPSCSLSLSHCESAIRWLWGAVAPPSLCALLSIFVLFAIVGPRALGGRDATPRTRRHHTGRR